MRNEPRDILRRHFGYAGFRPGQEPVNAQALHAGHGGHFLHLVLAFEYEDRPDQVVCCHCGFANEAA